jgi:hypothetical protein
MNIGSGGRRKFVERNRCGELGRKMLAERNSCTVRTRRTICVEWN